MTTTKMDSLFPILTEISVIQIQDRNIRASLITYATEESPRKISFIKFLNIFHKCQDMCIISKTKHYASTILNGLVDMHAHSASPIKSILLKESALRPKD